MQVANQHNQVCRRWAERPTEGNAKSCVESGARIEFKIDGVTGDVNFSAYRRDYKRYVPDSVLLAHKVGCVAVLPQQIHHSHGQQAQADNRVDLEKRPINAAQIVGPHQTMLVNEQQANGRDA